MITRSKLVEQLRDYQIRSQHKWVALFNPISPPVVDSELGESIPDKNRNLVAELPEQVRPNISDSCEPIGSHGKMGIMGRLEASHEGLHAQEYNLPGCTYSFVFAETVTYICRHDGEVVLILAETGLRSLVVVVERCLILCWRDIIGALSWGLLLCFLVISSYVTLYFRYFKLSAIIICLGILLPLCLQVCRQRKLAKKRERRLLLPLSM
ncbi:uncharacterized protein [Elaeis guineensis]|uniref:uncharacterized protein n=1 Tax=Elaeis guineensis var. tenera TaxID=51953 RepID=UPI003C6D62B2